MGLGIRSSVPIEVRALEVWVVEVESLQRFENYKLNPTRVSGIMVGE
jgi:hypothetical protein